MITCPYRYSWEKKYRDFIDNNHIMRNKKGLCIYLYSKRDLEKGLTGVGFKIEKLSAINILPVLIIKRIKYVGIWLEILITNFFKWFTLKRGNYLIAKCTKQN